MLVNKQTYSENHHYKNNFYQENNLNHMFAFVANVASFVFKSEFFTRL